MRKGTTFIRSLGRNSNCHMMAGMWYSRRSGVGGQGWQKERPSPGFSEDRPGREDDFVRDGWKIDRTCLNPLVSNRVPFAMLLMVAFAVLRASTRHEPVMSVHGFDPIAVPSDCATLFPVVVPGRRAGATRSTSATVACARWTVRAMHRTLAVQP